MTMRRALCLILALSQFAYFGSAAADERAAHSVLDVLLVNRCNLACSSVSARIRTGLIRAQVETDGAITTDLLHTFFTMLYYVRDEYFSDKAVIKIVSDGSQNDIKLSVRTASDGAFRCVGPNSAGDTDSVDMFVVFANPYEQHFDPSIKLAVNWCAGEFAKWVFGMSEDGQFLTPDWPLSEADTKSYVSALLYLNERGEVAVPEIVNMILRQ